MTLEKIQRDFRSTIQKLDRLLGQNDKSIEESEKAKNFHESRCESLKEENERARRFKQKLEELLN